MANTFNKEERVMFEEVLTAFDDGLAAFNNIKRRTLASDADMERSNDTIWIPEPYQMTSNTDGDDQTTNFASAGVKQLSVPIRANTRRTVIFSMTASELRDAIQSKSISEAATDELSTKIRQSILEELVNKGSIIKPFTTACTGFTELSSVNSAMDELGIPRSGRTIALSSTDYSTAAKELATNANFADPAVKRAYNAGIINNVAGLEVWNLGGGVRLTAATATGVTVNGANQVHTPTSTANGENVDNRGQNLTITVTGNTVKVGDSFTIANVYAINHKTKEVLPHLKTFKITKIVSGAGGSGVVEIYPAIVATGAYQNVDSVPANGAAITFLNIDTAYANPFWHKDAFMLVATKVQPERSGIAVMGKTLDCGIPVTISKGSDVNTLAAKYRFDIHFGANLVSPQMAGIALFNQVP